MGRKDQCVVRFENRGFATGTQDVRFRGAIVNWSVCAKLAVLRGAAD